MESKSPNSSKNDIYCMILMLIIIVLPLLVMLLMYLFEWLNFEHGTPWYIDIVPPLVYSVIILGICTILYFTNRILQLENKINSLEKLMKMKKDEVMK